MGELNLVLPFNEAVDKSVEMMDHNGTSSATRSLYASLTSALSAEVMYFRKNGLRETSAFVLYSNGFFGSLRKDSFQVRVHTKTGLVELVPPYHSFDNHVIDGVSRVRLNPGNETNVGTASETIYYRPERPLSVAETAQLSETAQLMIQMYEVLHPNSTQKSWEAYKKLLFEARYQTTKRRRGFGGIGLEPLSDDDFISEQF